MKRVKVFEDKQRVQNIEQTVKAGLEKVQGLVNAFNETGFRPVEPDEMPKLMANPLGLYNDRTSELELPPNVIREKYLSMINLPSTDNLKKAWEELRPHDLVRSPELVKLIADKVLVNDDKLEQLTGRYKIIVDEGSLRHEAAKEYLNFIDIVNNVSATRQFLVNPGDLANIVFITKKNDGSLVAMPTLEKMTEYMNRKTVKNNL